MSVYRGRAPFVTTVIIAVRVRPGIDGRALFILSFSQTAASSRTEKPRLITWSLPSKSAADRAEVSADPAGPDLVRGDGVVLYAPI